MKRQSLEFKASRCDGMNRLGQEPLQQTACGFDALAVVGLQGWLNVAAWDVATGKPLWKTERADEISTWGTPTIARTADGRDVLVTNGTKVRGYDPASGKQLWTLGPNSEITIGTPVAGNGLVYVTGGYPPVRPIYAIRPGAEGDISLQKGQESNPVDCVEQHDRGHVHSDAAASTTGICFTLTHQRHRHGVQTRRPASARFVAASALAAPSRRRRWERTGDSTSRARTVRC